MPMPLDCDWPTPEQQATASKQQDENKQNILDLQGIRKAAQENGYKEWFYCERYNGAILVAAFQKTQQDGDVIKIQVYPKTRAVSVCYFHNNGENNQQERTNAHNMENGKLKELFSTVKKSLFVSQNVDSVTKLSQLLQDPLEYDKNRIYTRRNHLNEKWIPSVADPSVKEFCANCHKPPAQGKTLLVCSKCKSVAYCNRNCQRIAWRTQHKKDCSECGELDISQRFCHVAIVTGLVTTTNDSEEQLVKLISICEMFDMLLFEPDGPPCMCRARLGCGSVCAISSMLLEIGREHHDVIGVTTQDYAMNRFFGQVNKTGNYQASFHPCEYHDEFMEAFGLHMQYLESQIVSLAPNIRLELLQWLFERIRCNEKLSMIDSNEMPLTKPNTTFPIHFANMDYSRLLFGDDADQAICYTHGTFHQLSYEQQDEGDDVSDAGTEQTANESDDDDAEGEGNQ